MEGVIERLAVELSQPQMLEMATEISATLIGMGTEVWGDLRICTVENMWEASLRLGDAAQMVKLLRDNPYGAQSALSPEPSGVSLGSVDSFSQDTQLLEEEGDEEVVVSSGVLK